MMRKLVVFIIVLIIVGFYSCSKDELTIPTSVEFEFSMNSFTQNGNSTKAGAYFEITEGTIVVESIEFDGNRDVGEDYFFTSDFSTPLKAELHNRVTNQNVQYDIPQGVYTRVELNFSLGDGNEDAICLKGKYHRGPLDTIVIQFEYAFKEQIRVRARNHQNSEQIVLESDSNTKASVVFDTSHLFQIISMKMIHEAEVSQIENKNVILINNENNTSIFNVLVTRLDNSMRVVIDE